MVVTSHLIFLGLGGHQQEALLVVCLGVRDKSSGEAFVCVVTCAQH